MKNLSSSLAILSTLLLSSCASMYQGVVSRTNVNASGEVRRYEPVGAKGYAIENTDLKVVYVPDIADAGVSFQFENKTDKPVKIVWDESSFIDSDGQSAKVIHSGVRLMEKGASQPPSMIPPMAKLSDDMVPANHVGFEAGRYGGWTYTPLCGTPSTFTRRLDDETCVGKTLGFFVTYEIDGNKKNVSVRYKYLGKAEEKKTERATAGK